MQIPLWCYVFFCVSWFATACADIHTQCRKWGIEGKCQNLSTNVKTECCQTCASVDSCDADTDPICPLWARQGYCDLADHRNYMLENCCFSCNHNWTVSPEGPSCEGDRSRYCGLWAKQGYCQVRPMYMNQTCCQTCGDWANVTGQHCKPLNATRAKDQALNIVLVPSAFKGDMELWREMAKRTTETFSQYKPLNVENVPFLNIWYIDIDMPDDDGQQCVFGCFDVERSLHCPGMDKFVGHAKFHCGTGFIMNTLIVHNSDQYGGAGLPRKGVAFVSTNVLSPQIAVHELGHSLFGLTDEYEYSKQAIPESSPNCDYAGCPKWKDLQGRGNVGCVPGKCKDGQYYVAEESIMESLEPSFKFGAVNERVSCCKYLFHFGETPSYCQTYSEGGLNLRSFCSATMWKGQYAVMGSLPSEELVISFQTAGGSPPLITHEATTKYMTSVAEDTQGDEFVYVNKPKEWKLMQFDDGERWGCVPSLNEVDPGLYSRQSVEGDVAEDNAVATLIVGVLGSTGIWLRNITVFTEDHIEIPAEPNATRSGADISVSRLLIVLILNEGEVCHLPSASITHATDNRIRAAQPFGDCNEGVSMSQVNEAQQMYSAALIFSLFSYFELASTFAGP